MTMSRRQFLESTSASLSVAAAAPPSAPDVPFQDGPASPGFSPVPLKGNVSFDDLKNAGLSQAMADAIPQAPRGSCISWGIPFQIDRPLFLDGQPLTQQTPGLKAGWLVFLHTTDSKPLERDDCGFIRPMRGEGYLSARGRLRHHVR